MQKSPTIEFLRILGALGIVWYHARGPGYEAAYAGLVLFLIMSVYLAGPVPAGGLPVARRARRLLLPWLLWQLVYGAVNLATHQPLLPTEHGLLAGVLAGASIHLWYLPFIFIFLLGYDLLRSHVPARPIAILGGAGAALMLGATAWWWPLLSTLGYPLAQYVHASAGLGLGMYFANAATLPWHLRAVLTGAIALAVAGALAFHGVGLPYLLGIAVAGLLLAPPLPAHLGRWINPLGAATFGVYCAHILVMRILAKFTHVEGALLPVSTFVVSMAVVMLAQRALARFKRDRRSQPRSIAAGSARGGAGL
jgi:fucose 4-O-acetylase-like acetyltransferase